MSKRFTVDAASVSKVTAEENNSELSESKEEDEDEKEEEGTKGKKKRVGFRDRKVNLFVF